MVSTLFFADRRFERSDSDSSNPGHFIVVTLKFETIVGQQPAREITKLIASSESQSSSETNRAERFIKQSDGDISNVSLIRATGSPVVNLAFSFKTILCHHPLSGTLKRP